MYVCAFHHQPQILQISVPIGNRKRPRRVKNVEQLRDVAGRTRREGCGGKEPDRRVNREKQR